MSKELSSKLKLVREKLGLTQERFAKELGISVKSLHNWEQDRTTPRGFALKALDEKLNDLLKSVSGS